MGKYQNKREGRTKSVISRTPCTDLGGVSKRAELPLSSTNRGRGEINESPQILGATPKATQSAKAAAWKQQIC